MNNRLTISDCEKELEHYVGKKYKEMTLAKIVDILRQKGFNIDIMDTIQDVLQIVKKKYQEEHSE